MKRINQNMDSSINKKLKIKNNTSIFGLHIIENFINNLEEEGLISLINKEDKWNKSLTRRTIHYGYEYDYYKKILKVAQNIPEWLNELIQKVNLYFNDNELIDQIIINEYKEGQGITKHIDHKLLFGKTIATITLNYEVPIIFRKGKEEVSINAYRRSLLLLQENARNYWTHELIMPNNINEKRISITFRSTINNQLKNQN